MGQKIQSDRVFASLRDEILACRMPPSSKIRITTICERFHVSLGAAREALSRLVSDGLVRSEPQKGFTVAPVSLAELQDLTEARIRIEGCCLEAAITSGDLEWETQIVAATHRLRRIEPKRPGHPTELNPDWSEAHATYHLALVGACRNKVLLRLRAMLYDESERYRHWCLPLVTAKSTRNVLQEHQAIADAVVARELAASIDLMRAHLQATADLLATSSVIQVAEQAIGSAKSRPRRRDPRATT